MTRLSSLAYRPCVGLMVINAHKKILTGQRIGYSSIAWQMPQGGLENGENTLAAAYRELQEETSIQKHDTRLLAVSKKWLNYDLPAELVPKLWNGSYRGQKQKWFLMQFVGDDNDINLQTEMPEFSQWRWSSKQQLINSIVPFKKKIYKNIIEEFDQFL